MMFQLIFSIFFHQSTFSLIISIDKKDRNQSVLNSWCSCWGTKNSQVLNLDVRFFDDDNSLFPQSFDEILYGHHAHWNYRSITICQIIIHHHKDQLQEINFFNLKSINIIWLLKDDQAFLIFRFNLLITQVAW